MAGRCKCLLLVTVAVAVLAAGCDKDGSSSKSTFTEPTSFLPDDGCTEELPARLNVTTSATAEVPYLDSIVACTSDGQDSTLLINNSDVAWTIGSNPGGANVEQLTNGLEVMSFRQAAREVYPSAVLAPKSTVRVDAEPSAVEWTLAPGLSVMWLVHEQLADTVRGFGKEQLTELLAGGTSLRRRALVTCAVAAYNIAGESAAALNAPNPAEQLFTGLGVAANTTQCALRWRQADDDAIRRFRATATWGDDVEKLARDASFLETANERLSILRRIGRALLILEK